MTRVELSDRELDRMTPERLDAFLRAHHLLGKTVQSWHDPINEVTVFFSLDKTPRHV
jgi:hypothetical protein